MYHACSKLIIYWSTIYNIGLQLLVYNNTAKIIIQIGILDFGTFDTSFTSIVCNV